MGRGQRNKGITLVSLVTTIIIMLIIAGVAISFISDPDGIIGKTNNIAEKYNESVENEKEQLDNIIYELNLVNAKITLDIIDIKCRSFIINTTIEGIIDEIIEVEYFINGESKAKIHEREYKIENLEPDTEYTIYIKAYNAKGNYYMSSIQTVITKPKVYLYNNGEEYTELTGGWKVPVSQNNASGRKEAGRILLSSTSLKNNWSVYAFSTQNIIDLSRYNNLKAVIEIPVSRETGGGSGIIVGIYDGKINYPTQKPYHRHEPNWTFPYIYKRGDSNTILTKSEIIVDISNNNLNAYPCIYIWTGGGTEAITAYMYEMWLEE